MLKYQHALASFRAPNLRSSSSLRSSPRRMSTYTDEKWWDENTVAIVTGSNKGIGFEVARELSKQGVTTVVTARQPRLGEEARDKIAATEGCSGKVLFHQLDIADAMSIIRFAAWAKKQFPQGIDILVNNAGMAYKGNVFGAAEAQKTLDTNFYGTMNLTEALRPCLRDGSARIVNVSSRAGKTSIVPSKQLLSLITSASSKEELGRLASKFVEDIQSGKHQQEGWPSSMYGISKLFLSMYTRLEARDMKERNIMVNACCPGWCQTDMSSGGGPKTALDGADTPVWLALRPPSQPVCGKFFGERTEQII